MTKDPFDVTESLYAESQPYSTMSKIVDAVWSFLTAVGLVAAFGIAGYFFGVWK